MSVFGLIPTCDDPMSIYTLVGFVLYSVALVGIVRWGGQRMAHQDTHAGEIADNMSQMRIDVAVTKESVANIEASIIETKTSVAEINRTLLYGMKER